jgi:DNA-binding CsgD family transcriptional regulator
LYGAVEGVPADRTRALAERALDVGLTGDVSADHATFYAAVSALIFSDELDLGFKAITAALASARTRGSLFDFAAASAFRAEVAYRMGNLALAEEDGRAALDAAGPTWMLAVMVALDALINVLIDRGDLGAAECLVAGEVAARLHGDGMTHRLALTALARLRVAQDAAHTAAADLLAVGRWCDAYGLRNPGFVAWRSSAALASLALGDVERAIRLADEEVELARPLGQPRALGIALRASGLVNSGRRGTDLLREAVGVLKHSPARLEHARALTDLGATLRRAGQRVDAREPLRQGLDLAHRCGATALLERARQELLATGARPRRLLVTGRDALTATEARIARMAAEGKSTPAIAQALFVTPKTVETHLGHAYQKLGINSRGQLPEALAVTDGGNHHWGSAGDASGATGTTGSDP